MMAGRLWRQGRLLLYDCSCFFMLICYIYSKISIFVKNYQMKQNDFEFPAVAYLSYENPKIMEKLISADIPKNINLGDNSDEPIHKKKKVQNEINYYEEKVLGPIKGTSISEIDSLNRVCISKPYCQFLWDIIYVTLKRRDATNVKDEIFAYSVKNMTTTDYVIKHIESYSTKSHLLTELNSFLSCLIKYDSVIAQCDDVQKAAHNLINCELNVDGILHYSSINMKDSYTTRINGVYTRAVSFILLHEMAHYQLEHIEPDAEDDANADFYAIEILLDNLENDPKESKTAVFGIIAALASMFYVTTDSGEDLQHHSNIKRFEDCYEQISSRNYAFANDISLFAADLLSNWTNYSYKENFPRKSGVPSKERLTEIVAYIKAQNMTI